MLQTTVYNRDNAVITGSYHDAKGNAIPVEFMGSAQECEDTVLELRLANDGTNEVQHVLNRVNHRVNARMEVPLQRGFALQDAWSSVVESTSN